MANLSAARRMDFHRKLPVQGTMVDERSEGQISDGCFISLPINIDRSCSVGAD